MISEFKERFENRHDHCRALKRNGKKIAACFYALVPKELIHAAGLVPVQLIEERGLQYEEKSKLLPYLCGLSKNLTGQIYDNVFDYVDAVMVSTVCDTNRHIFDIWSHKKVFPHMHLVRAPSMASEAAVKYYAAELKRLAGELEKISGKKVTEDSLRESIAQYNESRDLFRRLYELRPKSGLSAEDAIYIFGSALVTPVEEQNEMMKRLLTSLPPSTENQAETKLMLCAININMALDIIRMSEKYGAAVVIDDFTHNARFGSNNIEMDGDPFEAVARGYLRKVPVPGIYSFEERAAYIRDMMAQAEAKGMIYLVQLYCDAYAFEYAILKERFNAWNLVHLKLEAEDTPSSIEQLNVRIQSFIESLL